MEVRAYSFNNRTYYTIVDQWDCPVDPYVSAYINAELVHYQSNSTRVFVYELLEVITQFKDLPARVSSGVFISELEYRKFYIRCSTKKNSVIVEKNSSLSPTRKELRNAITSNRRADAKLANSTIQGRIRRLRKYVEWLYGHFHDNKFPPDSLTASYKSLVRKIRLDERRLTKNKSYQTKPACEDKSIPEEVYSKLMSIIEPTSADNPFVGSKLRNYLIVHLLLSTGIRRGELLNLKISDLCFYGSYDTFYVVEHLYDPLDSRIDKPKVKTNEHKSVMPSWLLKKIKLYIETIRSKVENSYKHDYLFVSEKNCRGTIGNPLSLNSINRIFKQLGLSLNYNFYPHLARRIWNEDFTEYGEISGINGDVLEDSRKYAMGWSHNSAMNRVYNENKLLEKTRRFHENHQERIFKK